MEAQLELTSEQVQIREQQKETWNKFSPGWKKWDDLTMEFLKPQGDAIIHSLNPKANELILDIASGTGEPGLTIASMVKDGKVIITDLSEGMLNVANEKAEKMGLKNIETKACDVSHLPFGDNTFDSISCRLGFMFFPDMILAAKEMYRVLKPGGKISTTVWASSDKNFWASATLNVINKNINVLAPPPGSPGLYRCAERGMIAHILNSIGFKNVSESDIKVKLNAITTDVYWNFMNDVVAPVVAAMSKADAAMKSKIKSEVLHSITQRYPEGEINIDGCALIISGTK